MQTEVRDPEDKLILSRIYSAQGEFTLYTVYTENCNLKINFVRLSEQVAYHSHRMRLASTPFAYSPIPQHGLVASSCVSTLKWQPENILSIMLKWLNRRR